MQDLNVISRQNAEAAEQEGLNAARQSGKFVVAEFSGLHLVGYQAFSNRDDAVARAHETPATVDVRYKLLNPTGEPAGITRDQSEDQAPEVTLGDYIARKAA